MVSKSHLTSSISHMASVILESQCKVAKVRSNVVHIEDGHGSIVCNILNAETLLVELLNEVNNLVGKEEFIVLIGKTSIEVRHTSELVLAKLSNDGVLLLSNTGKLTATRSKVCSSLFFQYYLKTGSFKMDEVELEDTTVKLVKELIANPTYQQALTTANELKKVQTLANLNNRNAKLELENIAQQLIESIEPKRVVKEEFLAQSLHSWASKGKIVKSKLSEFTSEDGLLSLCFSYAAARIMNTLSNTAVKVEAGEQLNSYLTNEVNYNTSLYLIHNTDLIAYLTKEFIKDNFGKFKHVTAPKGKQTSILAELVNSALLGRKTDLDEFNRALDVASTQHSNALRPILTTVAEVYKQLMLADSQSPLTSLDSYIQTILNNNTPGELHLIYNEDSSVAIDSKVIIDDHAEPTAKTKEIADELKYTLLSPDTNCIHVMIDGNTINLKINNKLYTVVVTADEDEAVMVSDGKSLSLISHLHLLVRNNSKVEEVNLF